MGLEPTHIVPVCAALWVVNEALLAPLSVVEPLTYGPLENGWIALQWLAALPLLLWPSRQGAERAATAAGYPGSGSTHYLDWRGGAG